MKRTLIMVVLAGLLVAADEPKDHPELEKAINALNDAFAKNDVAAIKRLMTEDHVAIAPYYGGPASLADLIKSLPDHKISVYKAGKMSFQTVSKDVVFVSYLLTQKGTYKGKALAPKSYASAVWVKRDGRWLEATYQETALEGE